VRQKVSVHSASAVQVVDAIAALLHGQNLGIESIRRISESIDAMVTPGAETDFVDSLKAVNQKIGAELEPKIKEAQAATQRSIDQRVEALRGANQAANEAKQAADRDDEAWFNCVADEQKKKQAAEDAQVKLTAAVDAETKACQLQQDNRHFSFQAGEVDLSVHCDHGIDGNCAQELQSFEKVLEGIEQNADSTLKDHRARYDELKAACDSRREERKAAQGVKDSADAAWSEKRAACKASKQALDASICEYGKKVAGKCAREGEYSDLFDAASGRGNKDSEADRKQEWHTMRTTKCLLARSVEKGLGGPVDASDLDACSSQVNYGEQVGTLNLREEETNQLASANACVEGPIKFSNGQTWDVPEVEPRASEYVEKSFAPRLDPKEGFGGCRASLKPTFID